MLLVVSVYPFCWIFRYVCYEYNGLTATYTGMHNFERMLTDTTFWQSVLHTFEYAVLKIIFIIPLALIMAVFLNQKLRGSSFFRGSILCRRSFLPQCQVWYSDLSLRRINGVFKRRVKGDRRDRAEC